MEKNFSLNLNLTHSEFCELFTVFMGIAANEIVPDDNPLKSLSIKVVAAGTAIADNKTLIYLDQVKRAMMNAIQNNPDAADDIGFGMMELAAKMPELKIPGSE